MRALEWFLVGLALAGGIPPLVGCYQFMLAACQRLRLGRSIAPLYPRVVVVVPAWNEGAVIARTLDRLVELEYPADRLRIYVVDDASTDETPDIVRGKALEYPGAVFHLRRETGGEGKAATINHGLELIQAEDWYDAVMIIDADVILTLDALRTMTRRLADPEVGAVTAYIKEGSEPSAYLNRFVAFEYITAQAAARRAQNVLGVQACLAGGSQLVTRETLEGIGGQIDTTTLAEDTVTTFKIQLIGKRVVFEPNAIVWAEEPREVEGLWKQRLRWGRGNVQVTLKFRDVWLRRHNGGRLGGISFALIWFSVTLMPLFMIGASVGLISLYLIDREFSVSVFQTLWAINLFSYLFITISSFSVDPETSKRCWLEGIMFPGLISLAIIVYASYPPLLTSIGVNPASVELSVVIIAIYAWLSLSMLAAFLVRCLAKSGHLPWLIAPLVYIVGYGPLLTAITTAAYVKELQGAEMSWDKTEKTGQLGEVL
jgi:cellulose synthase/poly-beta-1,6-N-acetylglucosamine synthase-like glycosyltransferase